VLPEIVADLGLDACFVLGGDQQLLDADGAAVAVADRDLRLAVRAQVWERLVLAHLGEPLGKLVRERDRQRHQLVGLTRRVAEHHPLVTGPGDIELVIGPASARASIGVVHALRDVWRLLVDRIEHRARVRAEAEICIDVADRANRLAHDLLNIERRSSRDLP
jgi:hypothetical protein